MGAESRRGPGRPRALAFRRSTLLRFDTIPRATSGREFLKAFLVWHQIEFPEIHDLNNLLRLVSTRDNKLSEGLQGILLLTDYGVDTRYPNGMPDLTANEASRATELARQNQRCGFQGVIGGPATRKDRRLKTGACSFR